MQYLVHFTSHNYAGPTEYVLVLAGSSEEAEIKVSDFVQDFFYQEDCEQLEEDELEHEDCFAVITSVEEFTEAHSFWAVRESIQGYHV